MELMSRDVVIKTKITKTLQGTVLVLVESLPCCLFLSSLLHEVHSHVRCRNPGKETWKNRRVPHRMSRRFWSMHEVHWMSCRDFSAFRCLQELRSQFPDVFGSLHLNSDCDFAFEHVDTKAIRQETLLKSGASRPPKEAWCVTWQR